MKITGKNLRAMFDYQKIAGNEKLAGIIAETESRYEGSMELSDDDLFQVNAAGPATDVNKLGSVVTRPTPVPTKGKGIFSAPRP